MRLTSVSLAFALAALLIGHAARAGNGEKPTRPVTWPESESCIRVVDRAQNPVVMLAYGFEGDDDVIDPNDHSELPDSRRHQFFAFCMTRPPDTTLPLWISNADYDRAARAGLMASAPLADFVLDDVQAWRGCMFRINADDQRRPITRSSAAQGIAWDTTTVPLGTYAIEGYTWEPPDNLWNPRSRPGLIRIIDGSSASESPPSVNFGLGDMYLYSDESITVEACAIAAEGGTYDLRWLSSDQVAGPMPEDGFASLFEAHGEIVVQGAPIPADGRIELEFHAGEIPASGLDLALEIRVRDTQGRTHRALRRDRVSYLAEQGCIGCEPVAHSGQELGEVHTDSGCAVTARTQSSASAAWPHLARLAWGWMHRRQS